jgi:hypothetical protein
MIVTIHQPEYLPYLGFFDRIKKADAFVVLDNVQYQKNAFINRNKIKTPQGWQWLTVPIKNREALNNINEMEINNETNWRESHWKALLYNYKKAPYFEKYAGFFEEVYKKDWKLINDLNIYLIRGIMDLFGLKKEIIIASSLGVEGKSDDLLIDICQKLRANTYLAGSGGKEYMDLEKFKKQNIEVIFHEFTHPIYKQQFGEFIPNLSVIDFIFNDSKMR